MRMMWTEALQGLIIGGAIGASIGLGVCVWFIDGTWLFPGDTMLIGAILGGIGGLIWGETFIERIKELWWWT